MATKNTEAVMDTTDEQVTASEMVLVGDDASNAVAGKGIGDEIRDLVNGAPAMFSSYVGSDFKTKLKVLSGLANSTPIADHIGTVISVEHILVQTVILKNEATGKMEEQPRVILVDKDGIPYHAISKGIWNSIKTLMGVAGHPTTWDAPIDIIVERVKANGQGHYFAVKYA